MGVAAEGDFGDVVGGEVGGRVGVSSPSGAPVAVLGSVGVDSGPTPAAVAGLGGLGAELAPVAVVGVSVFGAAAFDLQFGASGLGAGFEA